MSDLNQHNDLLSEVLTLSLTQSERNYPVIIRSGVLPEIVKLVGAVLPKTKKIVVVSDETLSTLYGDKLNTSFDTSSIDIEWCVLECGEEHKTLASVQRIYEACQKFGVQRQDAILALGGGVVGDMAGFAAATYLRGVHYIQCPTTLLAQVDSSVGGKTGVNLPSTKNAVGAFYQPHLVLADTDTLSTLPEREWHAGLGEVLKYALIEKTVTPHITDDTSLYTWLIDHSEALKNNSSQSSLLWAEMVTRCCSIKADVVMQDERETTGARALLNLGHTFAHAIESLTNYQSYRHGEAVSIGMAMALAFSKQQNQITEDDYQRALDLLSAYGLPVLLREPTGTFSVDAFLEVMHHDKKNTSSHITLIVPVSPLGSVIKQNDVTDAQIKTGLTDFL